MPRAVEHNFYKISINYYVFNPPIVGFGVFQSCSILEPILFLVYVDGIHQVVDLKPSGLTACNLTA